MASINGCVLLRYNSVLYKNCSYYIFQFLEEISNIVLFFRSVFFGGLCGSMSELELFFYSRRKMEMRLS